MPLVSRLRQAELKLDRETASVEVRRWLAEVANLRVHGDTGAVPAERLVEQRKALQLLGHSHVDTTMIYTHVLNRGTGVLSPLDDPLPGSSTPVTVPAMNVRFGAN